MNELRARLRSFRYAFAGVRLLFGEEHNARIHATITVLVVVAGIVIVAEVEVMQGKLGSDCYLFV